MLKYQLDLIDLSYDLRKIKDSKCLAEDDLCYESVNFINATRSWDFSRIGRIGKGGMSIRNAKNCANI